MRSLGFCFSRPKYRVVTELLKRLSVILHDAVHYPDEGLIVLDPGILPVIVLLGFRYALSAATFAGMSFVVSSRTRSLSCQSMSPNCSLNVCKLLESRSIPALLTTAAASRYGSDFGVFVSEGDSHGGALLYQIAVHVDGFEEAARGPSSFGAGNLGIRKLRKIDCFSPRASTAGPITESRSWPTSWEQSGMPTSLRVGGCSAIPAIGN
jgi:hypothetical protein